jgi:peptidyl-dipeptidase A
LRRQKVIDLKGPIAVIVGDVKLRIASLLVLAAACSGPKQPSGSGSAANGTTGTAEVKPSPAEEAKAFVAKVDEDLRKLLIASSQAEWAKQTNITDENEKAAAAAGEALMNYTTTTIKASRKFDAVRDQLDADTRRKLLLIQISGTPAPDDPKEAAELAALATEMDAIYGKSKVCDAAGKNCKELGDLEEVLAKSRKPAEQLAAWQGWHDTTGRAERDKYIRFVSLANAGARGIGFPDVGAMWRSGYDMSPEDFQAETDRLWNQVKPLYEQVHCYARRQLNKKYTAKVVPNAGPIPAHLLGNMWAQSWEYIYPDLEPFKGVQQLDVTPALVQQKYDAIKMVKAAEGFFVSLGMEPLPDSFWERSMLTKPEGKDVVCHASAWDVMFNNDLRIKMCIKPNHEDLVTIHHELGHNYYFTNYYTLPVLYQNGANDGFHEAIGDTIALSMTPDYLQKAGLLDKVVKNDKATINQQLRLALEKVAFLPFGLVVDRWRWDVFAGKVAPEEYNQHWWNLRKQYQGIAPAVPRAATDFDPGAKYHVPANVPYTRYFLAHILQFQFHRALCKKAGFTGPLHECSIYGSKEAGASLKAMLAMGASRPWPEALKAMTGESQMDASAILDYFAPLTTWLAEQNKGSSCGW